VFARAFLDALVKKVSRERESKKRRKEEKENKQREAMITRHF